MINALTVDIEEPFWVETIRKYPQIMNTFSRHYRQGVVRLLDFLDSKKVRGTFFVVGTVASDYPDLIKEISDRGHRLGIHSYYHRSLATLSGNEYREEIRQAKNSIESITGIEVLSHRAPTWSIIDSTLWVLEILEEFGIKYDSSIYPIEMSVSGMRGVPSHPFKIKNMDIIEFPPGVVEFSGFAVPFSGGSFLRLIPMSVIRLGYRKNHKEGYPGLLYVQPWEQDADAVEIYGPGMLDNLERTIDINIERIDKILDEFEFAPLEEAMDQVENIETIDIYGTAFNNN